MLVGSLPEEGYPSRLNRGDAGGKSDDPGAAGGPGDHDLCGRSDDLEGLKDISRRGEDRAVLAAAAATIACENALDRAERLARQVLVATHSEDALAVLRRLAHPFPVDTLAVREAIAARLVEAERWIV